jgi:hypothetical protein
MKDLYASPKSSLRVVLLGALAPARRKLIRVAEVVKIIVRGGPAPHPWSPR